MAYVQANFNCITQEIVRPDKPIPFPDLNLPTPHPDSNDDLPDEDGPYPVDERKPIWWYHSDHLGSSTYLTDNFGRPSHYYETLPFGEMIVEHNQSTTYSGGQYENAYKFNGKELDGATGMYYYGARYYDPRISIFISVDPLAEKYPDYTPYHYTLNNPINFVDPDGRDVYRRDGDKFIFVRLNNENEGKKDHVGVFIKNKDGEFVQDMDSNGNLKYEAKDIAKGIFSKYQSFTGSDKYFDVNGNHSDGSAQLTENDILDFAVKLQSMVKKEISGYALSDKSVGGEITGMIIEPYKTKDYENTEDTSYSKQFKAMTAIPRPVADLIDRKVFPFYHFHTHPDASPPSDADKKAAGKNPNVDRFIINNRFQKLQYGQKGFFTKKK